MFNYYKLFKPLLFLLPPEASHNLAITALKSNILPNQENFEDDALRSEVFGLSFKNPVGLSAGFDKNAECLKSLSKQNFGFAEVGTSTPIAQKGNDKPRIFRLEQDQAIINRLGFNNDGLEIFSQRLRKWKYTKFDESKMIVGANIGKNKDSEDFASDYLQGIESVYGLCDYVTINISSPNTPGLRDLQKEEHLRDLVKAITSKKREIKTKYKGELPILVKISPDEDNASLERMADIFLSEKIDGVIISNTTISRDTLSNNFAEKNAQGGLSGKPLFDLSTEKLEYFYKITKGQIPIIGVGGISSAEDAYTKIKKGASLIQIYTAIIYNGFELVNKINKELVQLIKKDGFDNISQAIGCDIK
jgi:dihydroorotate dehydrogenase